MAEIPIYAETCEDLQRLLESRHLDLRRRTRDSGDLNGLHGSAYLRNKKAVDS